MVLFLQISLPTCNCSSQHKQYYCSSVLSKSLLEFQLKSNCLKYNIFLLKSYFAVVKVDINITILFFDFDKPISRRIFGSFSNLPLTSTRMKLSNCSEAFIYGSSYNSIKHSNFYLLQPIRQLRCELWEALNFWAILTQLV